MNSVWKNLKKWLDIITNNPAAPPISGGAGNLIRKMSEEESKIGENDKNEAEYKYITPPPESIATIVFKYGNRDIYKDVYQFIQT